MTEIPEDVRERATAVARRWYHEEWEPEAYIQQELVKEIALAIMDERERTIRDCAAIAQEECDSEISHLILNPLEPKK